MRLRTLAPAKINVCLFLGPTRTADGRHELVTVMQSVSLADRVTLEVLDDGVSDEVATPGIEPGQDLVTRALRALRERGVDVPPVRVTVDKRIPVAGGMAGGSADAGAALRLGAHAAGGDVDRDTLREIGATLGADVPAQVRPGRYLATGAGERLRRVPGTPPYAVLVVPDAGGLSTADVFDEADRLGLARDAGGLADALASVEAGLPDLPDELCVNELEPAALSLRPDLGGRLDALRDAGADVALVSGSGPTVLGLFRDERAAEAARARFPSARLAQPVGHDVGEVLPA